jgi:hypothetical protein
VRSDEQPPGLAVNRRVLAGFALVPLAVAPIAWASTGLSSSNPRPDPRALVPLSLERETGCPGKWRWAVKTLSDKPQASTVSFYSRLKTVAELGALPRPSVKINSATLSVPRQAGPEKKTYRVNAVLVKFAKEDDGDIHLVIADPGPNGKRMVAEFPNADCDGAALSAKQPEMAAARTTLLDHCGPAPSSFKRLEGTATVKGVGFFDFKHAGDQADNWMELHPVVKLTNVVCKRVP